MTERSILQQGLNWIEVSRFKSVANTGKVTLGPINLIIGPNGSGKSDFIGAFSFLQAIMEGCLYDYLRTADGAHELLQFGTKKTQEIKFVAARVDHTAGIPEINFKVRL